MQVSMVVSLNKQWLASHKGDATPPLYVLMFHAKRMRGVQVTGSGQSYFEVTLNTDEVTEQSFEEKFLNYTGRRYTDKPAEEIISFDMILPVPEAEDDDRPIFSHYEEDLSDFFGDSESQPEEPQPPDPMEQIRALVGGEEFKELAEECVRVAPGLIKHNIVDTFIRQCYLFAINDGEGLSTYLEMFSDLLIYHKLLKAPTGDPIVEITMGGKAEDAVNNVRGAIRRAKAGGKIIAIDISNFMTALHEPRFRPLLECINEEATNNIVVFRVPFVEHDVLAGIKKSLSDILSVREVSMVPLDTAELLKLAGNDLERRGFQMDDDAWEILRSRIVDEKSDGRFYGVNTVNKVVREMIYMKQRNNALAGIDDAQIKRSEILELSDSYTREEKSGMEMLDGFVGMDKIKARVEEIVFQIEMALQNPELGSPCIHMRFVGNPGTGKTTVARVIGKILQERDVLRKGNFFEHAGRDFCGRFVGETAPKTAALCRDAYGSVLFIDEAYTLYRDGASTVDYGREAIDTLIAEMENHRSDLVVIMAGYSDEMATLMKANPGLESRMPYVIEFPNYTRSELCEIFMSMATKSFKVEDGLEAAVKAYFDDLPDEMLKSKEFSNARYVRNLFERTWGKAGVRSRLHHEQKIVIKPADFQAASSEKEFKRLITKKTRTLGFV